MRYFLVLQFIINVLTLHSLSLSKSSYIDIPTAHYNEGIYINLNGSYPIKPETEEITDINGGVEFSLNKIAAVLNWVSGTDFTLDISYQLLKERDNIPAISLGMDNLTYRKYISSIGHDDETYVDDKYTPRPPEVASLYLVATRAFNEYFELTAGMGRGRFVGYGPRSYLFNFDFFFDERHENIVFGLFGGLKLSIPRGLSLILETDGRDANLGIQYESGLFKGTIGLLKMEHYFFAPEVVRHTPRINASFSVKALSFEKPRKGRINIRLLAEEAGRPIPGKLIYEDSEKRAFNIPSTGRITVTLDSGIYLFRLSSPNYITKQAKIFVKSNQVRDIIVKLRKRVAVKKKPAPVEIKRRIESQRVNFVVNDAHISSIFYPLLDEIVKILKSNPNIRMEIGGHASAEGTFSYNQRISEDRARVVGGYLITQGIDPDRLSLKGYGMTRPVARNVTPEGRARNRRVQFTIISH